MSTVECSREDIVRDIKVAAVVSVVAMIVAITPGARAEAPSSLEGHWEGEIETPAARLTINVDLRSSSEGWSGDVSIPAQGARDLPLTGIRVDGTTAEFAIDGVPGNPKFTGEVREDGTALVGTFTQGGAEMPFELRRATSPVARARAALEGFDNLVEKALTDFDVPGAAVAVVVDSEVVVARGFGHRSVAEESPVTPNTLFAIGSSTKAFTTAVLGTLVDEGLVAWDDPVIEHMPDFRLVDRHATHELTVRDLVTHRSGLPRHDLAWYNSPASRAELVERLEFLEPFADLRQRFHYQNLMYLTAGVLVEQLSESSWEVAVRRRLLEPLGMRSANFSVVSMAASENHALPYRYADGELEQIPFRDITTIGPAGSINASLNDMTRWLRLQLSDGEVDGQRLLSRATLKEMHTPQMTLGMYPDRQERLLMSYGLGWFLEAYRGHYMVHHGGNIDGFSALVAFLPFDGVGVVVLTNANGSPLPTLLTRHVFDRVLALEPIDWLGEAKQRLDTAREAASEAEERQRGEQIQGTEPSHPLAAYVGTYRAPGYGVAEVRLADTQLSITYNRITTPLEHWHYDVFVGAKGAEDPTFEGFRFRFEMNLEGQIERLVAALEPEVEPIEMVRQPDARLYDPDFLQRFVGRYILQGQPITVDLRGDQLIMVVPQQPAYDLVPRRETSFDLEGLHGFWVRFVMQDDGSVAALESHQPNGVFVAERVDGSEE